MSDLRESPIIIVGAGAAGLIAAIFAAGGRYPVLLLEGTNRPGQKILISGGGRCNVLPSEAGPDDFHTDGSRHTLRNILAAWPLKSVRCFFEDELGVPLSLEPETGKLFPTSNRARTVLDALLTAAAQRGVQIRLGARVVGLARVEDCWEVRLSSGERLAASRVVLASGGLSVPATGSDGTGLRIAQSLGHSLVPTYPALVPLTGSSAGHRGLAGVSLTATLSAPLSGSKRTFTARGGFLFTHRGYSGPAVLNISHLAVRSTMNGPHTRIAVQWTNRDDDAWDVFLRERRGSLLPLLRGALPERLAAQLLHEAELTGADAAQLHRNDRARLVALLTRYPLPWTGHEGYKTAEVTGGGIPLSEVDPATLESRIAPGLHLCGEMLDAFGPIGGYNFLWAWVTGKIAGQACNHR